MRYPEWEKQKVQHRGTESTAQPLAATKRAISGMAVAGGFNHRDTEITEEDTENEVRRPDLKLRNLGFARNQNSERGTPCATS
jgi:hypothetical protein